MQKLVKRLSLVMAALMIALTALSNVPAKAATVVPKVQFVGEQKLEYTAGERITFNLNAANYGGRVQYRVVLWNDSTKSYGDLWNTADRYYTNWQPYGNETLPLGWVINEPGTYRITVYAKRAGLANSATALKGMNCDSYLNGPAFVVKPANTEADEKAEAAVKAAEASKKQADVDTAIKAVELVKNAELKAKLTERIKAINVLLVMDSFKAVGAKKLEVTFNKAVPADTALTLKKGLVPYPVTTTWNEAKTVATLTYAYDFSAGDYTVTATGLEAGLTATVAAPKVSKIELTDTYLPKKNGHVLGYKVYNQYNEEMTIAASALNISVYNVTTATAITVNNAATTPAVDLLAVAKDNQVIITITHTATGVNVSKVLAVNTAATVAQMQFGTVAPLTDKVRISVSENGFVLPYTFVDQYGVAVKLSAHTANTTGGNDVEDIDGIQFMTSNPAIVDPDTFAVDSTGKFTFNTGANAGTAIITAIVPSTGATGYFTVKVEAAGALKTFSMNGPAALVVEGETVKVPYVATDSFDNVIATKDFTFSGSVTFVSSNNAVVDATPGNDIAFNAKTGELQVTPSGNGVVTLYATVGGVLQNSIVLDVKALAIPTRVTGLVNVPTLFQNGASKALTAANVTVIDQYNREIDLGLIGGKTYKVVVTAKDGAANNVTISAPDITDVSTITIAGAAVGTVGTEELVFTLNDGADVADSAYTVTAKTIAAADIKSYTLDAVPTLYGNAAHTAASGYAKVLTLVGKDASGNAVTVDQSIITAITSSDVAVVGTDLASKKVFAIDKGTSTVAAWQGATKLAEVTVTATDAAPVAKTATFAASSYTIAAAGTLDLAAQLTVKDQYGVAIAKTGTWASSDATKANVSVAGLVSHAAAGTVTISFVTPNGVVVSVEVDLQ